MRRVRRRACRGELTAPQRDRASAPQATKLGPPRDRPFRVIAMHGFSEALLAQINDPAVQRIAQRTPIGSLDQFSDSTDLTSYLSWRPFIRQLYE